MTSKLEPPDIGLFGAGAWGTTLASAWAKQGARVALWGHPPEAAEDLARTRTHSRLPGLVLGDLVSVSSDPGEALSAPLWVSALPAQVSPEVWTRLIARTNARPELLVSASKGILMGTRKRISETLEPTLGVPVGVLSGPTFADEVAQELPAAVVLALPERVPENDARALQARLATPRLRVYLSRDVVGVELCGAFKNVLAIAAGLVEAMGLGCNARAALMTRGLAEMGRLVERMGGRSETLMGLAGMGDLFLTATGPQSRNRRFGEMVGSGRSPEQALASMGEQVVEGVATTQAALDLAEELGVELPITAELARLLQGTELGRCDRALPDNGVGGAGGDIANTASRRSPPDHVRASVDRLMNRNLKSE